jgi:hypothetical protein
LLKFGDALGECVAPFHFVVDAAVEDFDLALRSAMGGIRQIAAL